MRARRALSAIAVALLAACAPEIARPPLEDIAPPGFPEQAYREAAARHERVLRIDAAESLIVIDVHRGGSLSKLGHDHVIASHRVRGYVLPAAGRADLYVPLDRLEVDEPELRRESKLDSRPSAADIAGTRRNMLDRVLDVTTYPFAVVRVRRIGRDGDAEVATVQIDLHGASRVFDVPLEIERRNDTLIVRGRLSFRQSDFGMTPLSILNGAIQVADTIDLRFRIRATRGA